MSTNIKLKRSSVQGKQPNTAVLELGEIAINTYDGKIFFKKDSGVEEVVSLEQIDKTYVDALSIDAGTLDGANSAYYLDFGNFTGSDITLTGTGRIQGVDSVISDTDATSKSYVDQAVQSGGSAGYSVSTITNIPALDADYDLSYDTTQTEQETPFDAGGADAFGVNLGAVYDSMEPNGRMVVADYGDGEAYVGA